MFGVPSRYIVDCHHATLLPDTSYAALHNFGDRSHTCSVLFCPGCRVSQAVNITANTPVESMPRWRGQCLQCDHAWDFDDE